MQPCDKRTKLRKATLARCRMFLKAYLPFLPGYPVFTLEQTSPAIGWHAAGTDMRLTAETIRSAAFGWNELKKFPEVLPRAVENAEAWQRTVPTLLDRLGKAVHGKERLPESLWTPDFGYSQTEIRRAVGLRRGAAGLAPLLDAAGWLFVLAPERAPAVLDCLERRQDELAHLLKSWPGTEGIDLALLLVRLDEQDGPDRSASLFELLGTENVRHLATCHVSFLEKWNKALRAIAKRTRIPKRAETPQKTFKRESPKRPDAEVALAVADFARQVASLPTRERRETLDLFSECLPGDLLRRWGAWWKTVNPLLESAESLLERTRRGLREDNVKRSEQAKKIARQLEEAGRAAPPEFSIHLRYRDHGPGEILEILGGWNALPWKSHRKPLRTLLRKVSRERESHLPRLRALLGFHRNFLAYCHEIEKGTIRPDVLLEAWNFRDLPPENLVDILEAPWRAYESAGRDDLRRIGDALRHWLADLGQTEDLSDVIRIARSCESVQKTGAFLDEFARSEFHNTWYGDDILEIAVRSSESGPEFGRILAYLNTIANEEAGFGDGDSDRIVELIRFLDGTPWERCGREILARSEAARILDVAERLVFLRKRKIEVALPEFDGEAEPAPDWMARYPERFEPVLRRLAVLTPGAEILARRRLKQLHFDASEMTEEIAMLRQRLDAGLEAQAAERIKRRIENLSRRLERGRPSILSPARLEHLEAKLREQVRRLLFEKLRRETMFLFEKTICRDLEIAVYPAAWQETLACRIVRGVLDLDRPVVRRLGMKLLRHLAGERDWNYREEAANRNYLRRLEEQGIELAPWLDSGPAERILSSSNGSTGEVLFLGIERNPLEVLKMGAPFQTCLSPWGFNFFSTIANVLDVNKHVLYARDSRGTIRARCLIALTEAGELLAFHPYAHDSGLKFKEIVADFLKRLAAKMNTVVVDWGPVPLLVSPEWYDDGSIHVSDRFDFLAEGSEFGAKLAALPPDELPVELEKELAPLPLRSFVLRPLLKLPILEERPELILPLLPLVPRCLPGSDLLKVVKLAYRAGATGEAQRLMRVDLFGKMVEIFNSGWIADWENAAKELIAMDSGALLKHVRSLSPHGLRKQSECQAEARKRVLVLIYEKLGRKNKAKRIA